MHSLRDVVSSTVKGIAERVVIINDEDLYSVVAETFMKGWNMSDHYRGEEDAIDWMIKERNSAVERMKRKVEQNRKKLQDTP